MPDAVLAGEGTDGDLLEKLQALLRNPADRDTRAALADRLVEPDAHVWPA